MTNDVPMTTSKGCGGSREFDYVTVTRAKNWITLTTLDESLRVLVEVCDGRDAIAVYLGVESGMCLSDIFPDNWDELARDFYSPVYSYKDPDVYEVDPALVDATFDRVRFLLSNVWRYEFGEPLFELALFELASDAVMVAVEQVERDRYTSHRWDASFSEVDPAGGHR